MVRWLTKFFNYLDRYYIQRHSLSPLQDIGYQVFRGARRCRCSPPLPPACVTDAAPPPRSAPLAAPQTACTRS